MATGYETMHHKSDQKKFEIIEEIKEVEEKISNNQ